MDHRIPEVLIDAATIQQRIQQLAAQITTDYAEVTELVVVGVLRGCYLFVADLTRQLQLPTRVDFLSVASYSTENKAGSVRLLLDLRTDIQGAHVLLIDDIIDTGHTLNYLMQLLRAREPASLKTCVLVRKELRRKEPIEADYLGFDIPDQWVVGYGLDAGDRYRTLPYIGVLA